MNTNNKGLASVAVLLSGLLISGASAADVFSGGYVGGSIGVFNNIAAEASDARDSATVGVEDFPFGRLDLRAGYGEMVSPELYLGVEVAFTLLNNVSGTIASEREPGEDLSVSLEAGSGFALKAIVGRPVTPTTLLYGTVGYQQRKYELVVRWRDIWESGSASESDTFSGLGFGLGMRQELGERLLLTAEAFRASYSEANTDITDTQVDLGLIYRF